MLKWHRHRTPAYNRKFGQAICLKGPKNQLFTWVFCDGLYKYHVFTKEWNRIIGFEKMDGGLTGEFVRLAFNPHTNTLYAFDGFELITIDLETKQTEMIRKYVHTFDPIILLKKGNIHIPNLYMPYGTTHVVLEQTNRLIVAKWNKNRNLCESMEYSLQHQKFIHWNIDYKAKAPCIVAPKHEDYLIILGGYTRNEDRKIKIKHHTNIAIIDIKARKLMKSRWKCPIELIEATIIGNDNRDRLIVNSFIRPICQKHQIAQGMLPFVLIKMIAEFMTIETIHLIGRNESHNGISTQIKHYSLDITNIIQSIKPKRNFIH